jgi:4-hydroxy-3-methylbut-2-enyl diphosphate reductase
VDIALKRFSPPVYVRKEIVHNRAVVEDFKARGVVFIDHLDEAPEGSLVIFSAHGVSPDVRARAEARRLRVIDATCPLVTKVHLEVHRFLREGFQLVLIGHRSHDEVDGTLGEAPGQIQLVESVEDVAHLNVPPGGRVMILTQTTLSLNETRDVIAAIKQRFPDAQTPPKDYIGYRQPIGNDANLSSTLTSGASIHVAGAGSGNTAWLDLTPGDSNYTNAALTDGATFTDSINGLSITQVSHTAAGVTVTIASSQPACTPAAPTLSITPSSQTAGAGASASYTVSVVNKDSSTCPSSTFSLTSAAPAGWPATFSPASISLTPGASGSASYTVQVPANTADGVYTTSPQVADAQVSAHSTSGAASLTVFTDTVGPLISITSPSNGAKLKGNGNTNVAASASDSSGISAMVISMDGSVLKNCGAVSSCSYSLSNKSVSTGSHTITVSATDKLTNTTTKSITVTK